MEEINEKRYPCKELGSEMCAQPMGECQGYEHNSLDIHRKFGV